MSNLRRMIVLAICLAMVAALSACGGTPAPSSSTPSPGSQPEAETYVVGISQFMQHPALDAATKGFRDALTEKLGDRVTFEEQNAQNEPSTAATIANSFVSAGVDLILANATPSLQTAAAATADIPILGTAVTEYGVALDIQNFDGTVGGNVSGTSDLAPLDQQAAMVQEFFPDAKEVGLLYCSAEPNSLYQVNTVKAALETLGYTTQLYPFADSNDLAAITATAVAASDVLYLPTDNTVASNTGIIDNIARPARVPIIAGEQGICDGCGVATLSIDYYDLGYATGLMAAQVLTGEEDISAMPVQYAPNFTKMYNSVICEELGITPPQDYIAIRA